MPRCNRATGLQAQLDGDRCFSVDVLCRFLVTPPYRNTMHATSPFMAANQRALDRVDRVLNPATGMQVQGARPTYEAIGAWDELGEAERVALERDVRALLETDVEVDDNGEAIVQAEVEGPATAGADVPAEHTCPQLFAAQTGDRRVDIVQKLVAWIHEEPFQAHYRQRPVGRPIVGWDSRLRGYFWPDPQTGYKEVHQQMVPIQNGLSRLARKIEAGQRWTVDEEQQLIDLAHQLFRWGGVPQNQVTKRADGRIGNFPSGQLPALPLQEIAEKQIKADGLTEDQVKKAVDRWLRPEGWETKVQPGRERGIDIEAHRGGQRWIIEAKGSGSRPQMRVNYFLAVLGTILHRMDDPRARYSIALPDMPQFRRLWEGLPGLARARTTLSAIFVDQEGRVQHVTV
ncbi:MAG: hypothetical protein AB1634_06070 [Thermodesulfobacteriota bacterium]